MNRKDILETALHLTYGDRNKTHGDPYQQHLMISKLWSVYLGHNISPDEVAIMMTLLKISRTKAGHLNTDDYIDAAAYIAIASECKTTPSQT